MTNCLYFSETERVALFEYRRRFVGVGAVREPRLTFFAQVDLKHVVDLSRPAVLNMLRISPNDLSAAWRSAPSPTRLQRLGLAISVQHRVSAIGFASDACRRAGTPGMECRHLFRARSSRPAGYESSENQMLR
jgi:hypothetical protein